MHKEKFSNKNALCSTVTRCIGFVRSDFVPMIMWRSNRPPIAGPWQRLSNNTRLGLLPPIRWPPKRLLNRKSKQTKLTHGFSLSSYAAISCRTSGNRILQRDSAANCQDDAPLWLAKERVCGNRIHSVLAMRLIEPPMKSLFGKEGRQWLDRLTKEQIDRDGLDMITSDLRLLDSLQNEIDQFDDRLDQLGYQDPRVKLLMTMPGVSVVVAQALVAAFGDIKRFRTADKAAAYLGLTPSTKQSAKTCHHGSITKRGNSNARWMLVQAAQHMHRQPGPLGHFFRRIKGRKNHNIAVVATARKMAMIAWHMLKRNEPYRYSPPRSTETKLARLRVAVTGQKRKTGVAKGIKPKAKLPGGSRTIKSLDTIYDQENIPQRRQLPQGEIKHLQQTRTNEFVQTISQDQILPRKATPK